MHTESLQEWHHPHTFGVDERLTAERRTRWVVGVTAAMMLVEISCGLAFGSMALLADGWHMATHTVALGIAAFAYAFARRRASDPRFTFGTGKVTALGGFGSAVTLAVVAVLVFAESAARLARPGSIRFNEAIAVAAVGLLVNLLCALLLRDADHHDDDGHEHDHGHVSGHQHHHDHNLRGAYLHVLADALTSVLAIAALVAGKYWNMTWMDSVSGLLGAVVILRWSIGLLRDTGKVLLDADVPVRRRQEVASALEQGGDVRVADLHLWRVGRQHLAVIASLVTHEPREPGYYKARLERFPDLAHVTIEVHRCGSAETTGRAS